MTKESAALSNWADMIEHRMENDPGKPPLTLDEFRTLVQNLRFVAEKIDTTYEKHMDGYRR